MAIKLATATKGDSCFKGKGMNVTYGWHKTPFGEMLVAESKRGVCYLGFSKNGSRKMPLEKMQAHLPYADFEENSAAVKKTAERIVKLWRGQSAGGALALDLHGTPLQIKVWQRLLEIPTGETMTYRDIAKALRRPNAARPVGNAVGANPVSLIVPCHRVLPAAGGVGNYLWGPALKEKLLAAEGGL